MAFPNSSVTDLIATTMESRTGKVRDNVKKNTPLLMRLEKKGNVRTISGGRTIFEEFSFAENGNGAWYTGYDTLNTGAADVIGGAEFSIKQYAVGVSSSGLELLQNSGKEQLIDLVAQRIKVAESTMANAIETGLFSDGTGSSSKTLTGMDAAVPQAPTTGTYGGINRATASNAFWRSQLVDSASTPTATTIQADMNTLWAKCVRGSDQPDLIIAGGTIWATFLASLQLLQRFATPETGELGFPSLKFMSADVVLGGGIGGAATATDMYYLNTDYLYFRPHKDRNMVSLGKRQAFNQDASIEYLAFAGNMTCSGAQFQGRLKGD
jgi:hypothetical protein